MFTQLYLLDLTCSEQLNKSFCLTVILMMGSVDLYSAVAS